MADNRGIEDTNARPRGVHPLVKAGAVLLPMVAIGVAVLLVVQRMEATKPAFAFEQDSPEVLFASARRMVSEGRADLLTELAYANSDAEREVLRGIGGVLGAVQNAGYAAARAFPDEIERIRQQALDAASEGKASSILSMIGQGMGMGRSRGNIFSESDDPGADVVGSLLADPYGWIERNGDKLGVMTMGDRMAGVTWDGKPVLQPFPMLLELREDDKWYVMLPTNLPGVRQAIDEVIEDEERRRMLLLILQSVRQAFDDLAEGMRSGQIRNLDHAANKLGEYAMPPVGLGMIAFGRYMEIAQEARREERRKEREERQRRIEEQRAAEGKEPADGG